MDVELLKLNDTESFEDLKAYVNSIDSTYISLELPRILWKNDGAVIVQTLLNGLGNSRQCFVKKFQIAESILHEIETKELPQRISEKLVNLLAGEVDSFPTAQLLRLVDLCCDMIRRPSESKFACWKELLPKLLHLLVENKTIEHGGSIMTGDEYKSSVITSLCMVDWEHTILADLASMFKDMPLSKEEHARVVRKLGGLLNVVPTDVVPQLSHQLLLLTQHENSVVFFLALASYFNTNLYDKMDRASNSKRDERKLKDVSEIEETILYHVTNNPDGCHELLKVLKSCVWTPEFLLQPFLVTLLLALSSIPVYEDDTLSLLRTGFNRAITEADRHDESAWLRAMCPPRLDVNKLILRVLENCFRGRDTVLKGLVNFGFSLLSAGRGGDALHALGTSILENLVRRNKLITDVVLDTLNNYIKQVSDSSQYTDCLVVLGRKQPLSILECSKGISQLLETCLRVRARVATSLLIALLPLARLSHSVRDNVVTVLRKALFQQDIDRRLMAVRGFLELLRDLKISNLHNLSQSMSQNYCNMTQLCSQSLGGGASLSNEGLCLEVLSVLREVFKQQHEVKIVLYKGVYSSVRANADLGPHALDYLQTHIESWYEGDDAVTPLKFHQSVAIEGTKVVIVEPLGDLVLCISLLVAKLEDLNRSAKLQDMLDSICRRMAACTINSFNVEPEDGLIMDSNPESMKSQEVMRQILSVYEALFGYLLCVWNKGSSDKSEMFLQLFKAYTCFCDYARGLSAKKKGEKKSKSDKGKTVAFRFPDTVFNFKCCSRLLAAVTNDKVHWATEESTMQLRGKRELHRYAMQTTLQTIKEARAASPAELARDCHNIGYLCSIGRILFTKYVIRVAEMKGFDLHATVTALQAFSELLTLIHSHFKSKMPRFLGEIVSEPQGSQDADALHKIIEALLDQLDDVLGEDGQEEETREDLQTKKIPLLYLALLSALVNQVSAHSAFIMQVYGKIKNVCINKRLENFAEAKALIVLLLTLHRQVRFADDLQTQNMRQKSLMFDIGATLTSAMPLIDTEMEIGDHTQYKIVNLRTGNLCLVALCDSLHQHLSDIEWSTNRFKSTLVTLKYPAEKSVETRLAEQEDFESDLCQHMNTMVLVTSCVCVISMPPGVFADAVLRVLEAAYNKLTLLTKYYLAKVNKFHEKLHGSKFEKTVRLVDTELTKNMYCFTEHLIDYDTSVKRGNVNQLKARALKETKLIPKVILGKEQFHKLLLQLSKRAKYDITSKVKHAMTRDYKLYTRQLKEILENERVETEDMAVEEDDETGRSSHDENDSPVAKRRRSNVITDTQESSATQ